MRNARVWRALLGVEKTVIEGVEFDEVEQLLVARVRPARGARGRCGVCRRRCGRYDAGEGRRRWRALDAGTTRVFLEADAPRVRCAEHGVVVAHVPWARHGAGHTLAFDQTVAWLVTQCSKTAVTAADAHRLAHRRRDHRPGLGRRRSPRRPAGRADGGSASTRSPTSAAIAT